MVAKISGTLRNRREDSAVPQTPAFATFMRVLAETGNYALAADQVRVSHDWVFKLRRRDAEFDAACRGRLKVPA